LATGADVVVKASKGLDKATKCTWHFTVENGSVGPGFVLSNSIIGNYLLHYVEWIT